MNFIRIAGIVLIALGVLGLVYGGFSYTSERHDADLGPVNLEFNEKERVNLPPWVGVVTVIAGTGLLLYGRKGG